MQDNPFEKKWQKKSRFLTHILVISCALNVGLVATFGYFAFSKKHRKHLQKRINAITISQTNADVIKSFFQYSFDELILELENKELLEKGYTKRDLALAYLVDYHYLNLDQALSGYSYQKRQMSFIHHEGGEKVELMVYPGLIDEHFQCILSYIKTEKWPFSPEGLFNEIKIRKDQLTTDLKDAFYATPHFYTIYTLLSRAQTSISREEALAMLTEGKWNDLERFYLNQRTNPDLGQTQRQQLLRTYLSHHSKIAAYLLIRLEPDFTLSKLDDTEIIQLINQLSIKNAQVLQFLRQTLISIRSDEVHKRAAYALYAFANESPEEPFDYQKALLRFLPSVVENRQVKNAAYLAKRESLRDAIASKMHVVKEGDSLWKIAKQYNVTIDQIVQANQLKRSQLLPVGKKLKIP